MFKNQMPKKPMMKKNFKTQFNYSEVKAFDDMDKQMALIDQIMKEQAQILFSRKDSRNLSASQSGRRLRSSFDVFDIVNNAISSGVKEAKKTTNKALNDVKKLVNQSE